MSILLQTKITLQRRTIWPELCTLVMCVVVVVLEVSDVMVWALMRIPGSVSPSLLPCHQEKYLLLHTTLYSIAISLPYNCSVTVVSNWSHLRDLPVFSHFWIKSVLINICIVNCQVTAMPTSLRCNKHICPCVQVVRFPSLMLNGTGKYQKSEFVPAGTHMLLFSFPCGSLAFSVPPLFLSLLITHR